MQEHWCGLPFPTPGDLPHPGIEAVSHNDSLPLCQVTYVPCETKSVSIRDLSKTRMITE